MALEKTGSAKLKQMATEVSKDYMRMKSKKVTQQNVINESNSPKYNQNIMQQILQKQMALGDNSRGKNTPKSEDTGKEVEPEKKENLFKQLFSNSEYDSNYRAYRSYNNRLLAKKNLLPVSKDDEYSLEVTKKKEGKSKFAYGERFNEL